MLLSVPEAVEDLLAMKRLWVHEVLRVFCDRLVDDSDRAWLYATLHDVARKRLEVNMNELFVRLRTRETVKVTPYNSLLSSNLYLCFLPDWRSGAS